MDELLQRDPPVPADPPQSCHLSAVPALCLSEGRIPGKRPAVLAGGAEVQGERSWELQAQRESGAAAAALSSAGVQLPPISDRGITAF